MKMAAPPSSVDHEVIIGMLRGHEWHSSINSPTRRQFPVLTFQL
jgi:hypothetical protein